MITCPICGYTELVPPLKGEICPSCGTQFGLTDRGRTHQAIRELWIRHGACWSSDVIGKPAMWSAIEQLRNIGHMVNDEEKRLITPHEPATVVRMSIRNVNPAFAMAARSIFYPANSTRSIFQIANAVPRVRPLVSGSTPAQQIAYE